MQLITNLAKRHKMRVGQFLCNFKKWLNDVEKRELFYVDDIELEKRLKRFSLWIDSTI